VEKIIDGHQALCNCWLFGLYCVPFVTTITFFIEKSQAARILALRAACVNTDGLKN